MRVRNNSTKKQHAVIINGISYTWKPETEILFSDKLEDEVKDALENYADLEITLDHEIDGDLKEMGFSEIIKVLETKVSKKELSDIVISLVKQIEQAHRPGGIIEALNILSNKLEKTNSAIVAMATKLDAEEVVDLDDDYEESVNVVLNGG